MEFIGTLIKRISGRSGEGQAGPWVINQYLLETVEKFPRRMAVEVFNNVEPFEALIGKTVKVDFNIDAHEWNGKWFNSLRAYRISEYVPLEEHKRKPHTAKPTGEIVGQGSGQQEDSDAADNTQAATPPPPAASENDELPF